MKIITINFIIFVPFRLFKGFIFCCRSNQTNMKTEKEIVEELREGMASAFDILYGAYCQKVYVFVLSILKSREDAEEAVQETYFKIWENRKKMDPTQPFKSFLFTVAYRVAVDQLRERLKESKYREFIFEKATVSYNLEEAIEYGNLLSHIDLIVNDLPPRKHEIYQLSRVSHLSYREIAEKLNISVKTVENSINFSLNFLKSRFGKDSLIVILFALFLC